MKLLRTLITFGFLVGLAYAGTTIQLGERTFFGHITQIWSSDEAQELVEGVKETSSPMVDRLRRGIRAGIDEANRERSEAATTRDGSELETELDPELKGHE